ncbi:probable RNA-directed DNA polymerase from transposon X-element [Trichonephila clavipes]|uniref:Probable RNA-directed DNA polymerase from transposon X-element n=1 Tax=Trichonephila clavipes TaxID=2585209 RepID=A0A8X6WIA5_TRICX|nr:probable RNA-directed DNA polymerase from transposon X-element [Trichonephila clavipes]
MPEPVSSENPMASTSPSMPTVSTSSSLAEAHLLPSPSAIIPTTQSSSLLKIPIPTTTTTTSPSNNLNTSVSSLETETRSLTTSNKLATLSNETQQLVPLPESVPTTSNSEHSNAPEILQCVKRNPRNRRKRPKVQKPEIEIKMTPHRPRKSAPTEYATDEEDMITYDVEEEELETDPTFKFAFKESSSSYPNICVVWKEHCFPSSCREAIVIPILKPGKVATNPLSYGPIALTSCFCKTFERMINTRLVYVLEKEKLISSLQSGFLKGRSTLDNLVFLESQIRDAFVMRNHLVSLFFDIKKAYDRTWRYGILRNMHDFGLRENLPIFIFNFLAVRYSHVRIGHSSYKIMQDQGVPEGSVLSVTLFNIHMRSILHHLPPSVRGMLYVDDHQISCQGSDMRLIERQL